MAVVHVAFLLGIFVFRGLNGNENSGTDGAAVNVSRVVEWLMRQQAAGGGWGRDTSKVVIALSLANVTSPARASECTSGLARAVAFQLMTDYWREGPEAINRVRLAEYIIALSSVCENVKNFHGKNLLSLLGNQSTHLNFHYGYVALAVCLAGGRDRTTMYKLLFRIDKHQLANMTTDELSVITLSMKCVEKLYQLSLATDLSKVAKQLISRQRPDGGFANFHSTILSIEALRALQVSAWDEHGAMKYIMTHLRQDGSFGNIFDTTQVLPLLVNKSMLEIFSRDCRQRQSHSLAASSRNTGNHQHDTNTVWITFSLWQWIGLNVSAIYREELTVPANTSLFECLKIAAEKNADFEFYVTVWPNGHYVYRIGAHGEQKLGYHFWLLYRLAAPPDPANKPDKSLINPTGVDELYPVEGDQILFWYKNI